MDEMNRALEKEKSAQFKIMEERLKPPPKTEDQDLARPWRDFLVEVRRDGAPVQLAGCQVEVMRRVKALREKWSESRKRGSTSFTKLPIEKRQDILRHISRQFEADVHAVHSTFHLFDLDFYRRIMTSYAYIHDCEVSTSRFPWDVATRTLCDIKARAVSNGCTRTILEDFFNRLMIHKKFLTPLKQTTRRRT